MADEVQVIYDNWGNRASSHMPTVTVNGERVFKVGEYTVTVPDSHDEPAKIASEYRSWGRSENPMPNMSFSDGEMRIPVEDFVDLILRRVPADELAEGLWRDEDVRARFVECMGNRYAGSVEDEDRRSLLNKIQVQIYAKSIDRAIERLNNVESDLRAKSNRSRWESMQNGHYNGLYERYKVTLYEMREAGLIDDQAVIKRLDMLTTPDQMMQFYNEARDPVVAESVGKEWRDSRDYWRERLELTFAEPTEDAS